MASKATVLMLFAPFLLLGADDDKENARLKDSYEVMRTILGSPEKGIPKDLLDKSYCAVVFPGVKKGAFIVGASYGRGVMLCRSGENFDGPWTAPAMFALEGGSVGLQVGGQETDYVLLVMNAKGANSVMTSKVKLGADASIAGGPVGRSVSAETDAVMKAELLSWSHANGVFGGVSLSGSSMRSDDDANKAVYGKKMDAKEILKSTTIKPTAEGKPLVDLLQTSTPRHGVSGTSDRVAPATKK